MFWVALKMLTGNRGKYYAILFGIAVACMLMTQQLSIFVGLMRNTTSQIRDIQGADIWVMGPSVQFIDDINPLSENDLYRVRGVPGVAWAVRLYKGLARGQFPEGNYKQFLLIGLDDQTLVGAPPKMVFGTLADLRRPDAVVIDETGWRYLFPGEPIHAGRAFEMNDRRRGGWWAFSVMGWVWVWRRPLVRSWCGTAGWCSSCRGRCLLAREWPSL
jgi:putative ABC transport system permease protein